ncbi:MAG: hypothetical protein ACOZAK_01395 [Patescibacteria group bacterium]
MINPELSRSLRFRQDPEETPTSDMTPEELVEAGETEGTYISTNDEGQQVVVWPK